MNVLQMITQLSGITQSHLYTNQDEEMDGNNYNNMYNVKFESGCN